MIIRYGLQNIKTKKLMELYCSSNDGADFCNDTTCHGEGYGGAIFMAETLDDINTVLSGVPWYNSDHKHPKVSNPSEWEVVKFEIRVEGVF